MSTTSFISCFVLYYPCWLFTFYPLTDHDWKKYSVGKTIRYHLDK